MVIEVEQGAEDAEENEGMSRARNAYADEDEARPAEDSEEKKKKKNDLTLNMRRFV